METRKRSKGVLASWRGENINKGEDGGCRNPRPFTWRYSCKAVLLVALGSVRSCWIASRSVVGSSSSYQFGDATKGSQKSCTSCCRNGIGRRGVTVFGIQYKVSIDRTASSFALSQFLDEIGILAIKVFNQRRQTAHGQRHGFKLLKFFARHGIVGWHGPKQSVVQQDFKDSRTAIQGEDPFGIALPRQTQKLFKGPEWKREGFPAY